MKYDTLCNDDDTSRTFVVGSPLTLFKTVLFLNIQSLLDEFQSQLMLTSCVAYSYKRYTNLLARPATR